MKHSTLFLFFLFPAISTIYAQDSLNYNWLIGGSFGLHSSFNESPTQQVIYYGENSIYISPHLLRQLNPHWLLGVALSYRQNGYFRHDLNLTGSTKYGNTNRGINLGIIGRFNINPTHKLCFMLGPTANFGRGYGKSFQGINEPYKSKSIRCSVGMNLKVGYPISKRWLITVSEGEIGYNFYWSKSGEDYQKKAYGSSFSTDFGLSTLLFSLEYRLGKVK
jgi:hypothetical protein